MIMHGNTERKRRTEVRRRSRNVPVLFEREHAASSNNNITYLQLRLKLGDLLLQTPLLLVGLPGPVEAAGAAGAAGASGAAGAAGAAGGFGSASLRHREPVERRRRKCEPLVERVEILGGQDETTRRDTS